MAAHKRLPGELDKKPAERATYGSAMGLCCQAGLVRLYSDECCAWEEQRAAACDRLELGGLNPKPSGNYDEY